MKVLHLGSADNKPGASRAAYRLHKALLRIGVDSRMLVRRKITDDDFVYGEKNNAERVLHGVSAYLDRSLLRFSRFSNDGYRSVAFFGRSISKKMRLLGADITHLHWVCGGFLSVEEIGKLKGPVVWRLPDMWSFCGSEHYAWGSNRYIDGYNKNNREEGDSGFDIDRWVWKRKVRSWKKLNNLTIVAPCNWLAECASRSILFKNRRIEVIATGVDTELFRPIDKNVAREIIGVPQDKIVILFGCFGMNDTRKGGGQLADALLSVSKLIEKQNVAILTFGSEKNIVGSDCNIPVYNLGEVNDERFMPIVYSAADIFVAPSLHDNLPNTVLEAMACGVATVSSRTGGIPDAVTEGEEGLLVTPGNVKELTDAIRITIEKKDLRNKFSFNARKKILGRFAIEKSAAAYRDLYSDILSKL
jgi:glycosyltransferase involved in cell wall biosynthesis